MNPTVDYDQQRREHDDERRVRLVEAAQRADAELSVVSMYDNERQALGFDFGSGQRFAEIARKRRARDEAVIEAHRFGYGMRIGELSASREQCLDALRRISAKRLKRYAHQPHNRDTFERARAAWRRTERAILRMDA